MGPFIALGWSQGDEKARRAVEAFERRRAPDDRWTALLQSPGFAVYSTRRRPVRLRTLAPYGGVVLGELFDRGGADAPAQIHGVQGGSWSDDAGLLIDRYWGRYGAILRGSEGLIEGVLRDPSGALEVATWRRDGLRIVTSTFDEPLLAPWFEGVEVDWSVVATYLHDAGLVTGRSALHAITALAPGAALGVADQASPSPTQFWKPSRFAREVESDQARATRSLRVSVETCVAAHARSAGQILTEVSGGLDSSIVAACLVETHRSRLVWLHHTSEERGGDERVFVDLLERALHLQVERRVKLPFAIVAEDIARSQTGVRPSFAALDAPYDEQMVKVGRSKGVDRLFTGMAGDGLFVLSPSPAIAVDMLRRRGLGALCSRDFIAQARWTRRSIWRLGRHTLFSVVHRRARARATPPAWASPLYGPAPRHPWLTDADKLPPAKRQHVEELVQALLFYATSARAAAFDLVHPLFSQPVIELCLRIPVDLLTHGGRDRALARDAFRDRLPPGLIDRRSKGELGAYYSRAFNAGLPALRSYLLDGRLAEKGLLVPTELETALSPAHLAQFGGYGSLLRAVAVEGWVRHWGR